MSPRLRADSKQRRKGSSFEQFAPMVVDFVFEAGISCCVCTRLPLENDRTAIRHDEAGPNQQHTRLTKCDLAIIDTYQPGPLRHEKETPGRAIEDVFGDLGRER